MMMVIIKGEISLGQKEQTIMELELQEENGGMTEDPAEYLHQAEVDREQGGVEEVMEGR